MSAKKLNYLETGLRSLAWFNEQHQNNQLEMSPPFQRNPVWTTPQKQYLLDTILRNLPVPELYVQDLVDEHGKQKYIVVDGQQRIRSCLEFIEGRFALDPDESPEWGAVKFDGLEPGDKRQVFAYKFVVRSLPQVEQEELRGIFQRLNRNVVALNDQELRHATYWGPFIKFVESEADSNPFWGDSGLFSAQAIRRMLDVEFVSELVVAHLHGVQDKKKSLDDYYQMYEEEFEAADDVRATWQKTTAELAAVLPDLRQTRWKKRSDFYSLFVVAVAHVAEFPLAKEQRGALGEALRVFGSEVDRFLRASELEQLEEEWDATVSAYGRVVARAASDLANRRRRSDIVSALVDGALGRQEAKPAPPSDE